MRQTEFNPKTANKSYTRDVRDLQTSESVVAAAPLVHSFNAVPNACHPSVAHFNL
jgi:hypothetical protein